jgi:predicted nuclease of restriction endonuclease-like (RecB) superfamily
MDKNELIEWESTYQKISEVLKQARSSAWQAVNSAMVTAYWEIGKVIVEKEQEGKERAKYGKSLIEKLSERLAKEFGRGFSASNIWDMRIFYLTYPILQAVPRELSWTHIRLLLHIEKPEARAFYEKEAVNARWSTRELERQINSLLFERLALSKDKSGVLELAQKGQEIHNPTDLVKDPYVLEFTGIPESAKLLESTLEEALITRMQQFLLELGKGFSFVGRQQRITLDGDHFYIDLVFYNRFTKSFILIDLKRGKLTHQDIGQMQMYVNYYKREITTPEENPPIGIILCAEKNNAVVRFTLPDENKQIFISKYKLYLPTEEELIQELEKEQKALELLIKEGAEK